MDEISYEAVRAGLEDTNPAMEALAGVLHSIAQGAVYEVATFLAMAGVDPTTMPGEYFVQSLLVEAEKVFKPVDRESWIKIYDGYKQVSNILASNPELRRVREEALERAKAESRAEVAQAPQVTESADQAQSIIDKMFGDQS